MPSRISLIAEHRSNNRQDLGVLRKPSRLVLREDQLAISGNIEHAAIAALKGGIDPQLP
jgi:hypothetical protein